MQHADAAFLFAEVIDIIRPRFQLPFLFSSLE